MATTDSQKVAWTGLVTNEQQRGRRTHPNLLISVIYLHEQTHRVN